MGNLELPVYVTKPFLPPLEDFMPYLEKLRSLNYNGPICVEYVGEGDAKAAVKEDIETLRSWLASIS